MTRPSDEWFASCACGQLRAVCSGDPVLVSLCHCRDCQRRTGSAFGIAAFFPADAVATEGHASSFNRGSDSGSPVRFRFCPECGTTVFWTTDRKPGLVAVAVGCFADPAFPGPSKSVYEEHRQPWTAVKIPGG